MPDTEQSFHSQFDLFSSLLGLRPRSSHIVLPVKPPSAFASSPPGSEHVASLNTINPIP